jgi:hypothetical protein
MGVTVEAINEAFKVKLLGLRSEFPVVEHGFELTSGVISATLVLPKHLEDLLDAS